MKPNPRSILLWNHVIFVTVVGWVEGRDPTKVNLMLLGFTVFNSTYSGDRFFPIP